MIAIVAIICLMLGGCIGLFVGCVLAAAKDDQYDR